MEPMIKSIYAVISFRQSVAMHIFIGGCNMRCIIIANIDSQQWSVVAVSTELLCEMVE